MNHIDRLKNIVKDVKNQPNKELEYAMQFLSEDFELTKKTLVELTKRLDALEITYNKILEEYEKRNNVGNK